ncbi:hypothetical protein [Dechloromonas sp. A34]|uniref:hypothetical protein n=1 Tax=Dechloromonas sp. A34 TaxID=447588 RepID=UPI00224905C6|nr:hypothetical protein [Dechloromonas sp. A34]
MSVVRFRDWPPEYILEFQGKTPTTRGWRFALRNLIAFRYYPAVRATSSTTVPAVSSADMATRGGLLAKPNYQFEKRQRDLAKKNKQEEKRRQKLAGKPGDNSESADAAAESEAVMPAAGTTGVGTP